MRKQQRFMTEDFDNSPSDDEDWRKLASFGVERNQVILKSNGWLQLMTHPNLFEMIWCHTTTLSISYFNIILLASFKYLLCTHFCHIACSSFHSLGFRP